MTFSLLGRCGGTRRMGMVVSSSSPAVAARCAHVRAGVGVAASQNVTDPRLGPALLDALARTGDVRRAIADVVASGPHMRHRQLVLLDRDGAGHVHTGEGALGRHGHRIGPDCAAAGNLLADEAVLDAMVEGFGDEPGDDLGDRLLAALEAGLRAGGEAGEVRSAGLVMTGDVEWPIADLRVDWHDAPIAELRALWTVYEPQLDDYITRALDPEAAPGYGVPE